MCEATTYSESGAPTAPTRCKEYLALKDENARLREALRRVELFASRSNSSRADPWTILADIEDLIGNALKEVV